MKKVSIRGWLFASVVLAASLAARAQVIEFRATINAAQETPATTSTATGSAILLYDLGSNTFDLFVSLSGLSNTVTASHIHEGALGAAGGVVTNLGAEAVYTRSGTTVTGIFRGITHGGNKLTLLQNGAYVNFHSAQFPGGEVRGQLIARPVRLVAVMDVAQEQAAFPAVNLAGANLADFGAAVMSYDPGTNRISLRSSVYNFRNTLSNSHYHEGAPAVSGPVVLNLGNNANAGGYTSADGYIAGSFDLPYTGDPIKLLTGGAYLNYHSTTFAGGELRGQVRATNEIPSSRLINVSTRGFVGTGNQLLIQGISVTGPDPVRMLISAKGPSLAAFGVTGALTDPVLTLYDSAGRQIAQNDNVGNTTGTELANVPGAPTTAAESALLVVLPPGNYSAVVSGSGTTTGIALLEATDLRVIGLTPAATRPVITDVRTPAKMFLADTERLRQATRAALELCGGTPPTFSAVNR
ncbi:MAG: CHRD domain-containing protein [Verrucomicrobia bacterium]|nr:CHRD domain-containing protein [Verrucomicrobiota bacterium]